MSPSELIVVGGGGHGKEVAWLASEARTPFRVRGWLDDGLQGVSQVAGLPVLGGLDRWLKHQDCSFVVAVGSPRTRRDLVARMCASGKPDFATLIHGSVEISDSVTVGPGSMICAGSVLTVEIELGSHCLVNIGCTVSHESRLGDFCTLAPSVAISGNVTAENGVEIGTGASVRQGIRLGRGSMVGMGSVVVKDVEAGSTVWGNPARPKRDLGDF